jgi:hypothetical protein
MLASAASIAIAALASVTATGGPVAATLTATGASSGTSITGATGIRVSIVRGGAVAFDGPLPACRFGCEPNDPTGARFAQIAVADLEADGEPEVLVDRADGFTPCCTLETAILRRNPATGAYRELDRHWGESYRVADLDGDRRPELVTADLRFYERFAPRVAGFQLPVKILQLRGPVLVDVTRAHPANIRGHTRSLDRLIRTTDAIVEGRRPGDRTIARVALRPQLAAYVAEERLLGRRRVGDERIAYEVARGRVSAGFRHTLLRFLGRMGYR